jgi:hypothetical protein
MSVKFAQRIRVLVSGLCLASAMLCICNAAETQIRAPSDAMILGTFEAHRSEFERLRQMATQDMSRMSFFIERTISNVRVKARRDEYRRLLRLSRNLEVGTDYNGTVRFPYGSDRRPPESMIRL